MVTNGELNEDALETMRDVERAIVELPDLVEHMEHIRSALGLDDSHDDDDDDSDAAAGTVRL